MSIIPRLRHTWEKCVRVCQNCGEPHAYGQPTPSGRECKIVLPLKVSVFKKIVKDPEPVKSSIPVKDPVTRKCRKCKVDRPATEYSGELAFVCNPCKKVSAEANKKAAAKRVAEYKKRNPEKVAEWQRTTNKRRRVKQ